MQLRDILSTIVSLGIVAAGLGYAYGQFKGGARKEASDETKANTLALEYVQKQLTAMEEVAKVQDVKVKELTDKISYLQGQNDEKDKKLKEYMEILQNRNPHMEEYMKNTSEALTKIQEFMILISKQFQST